MKVIRTNYEDRIEVGLKRSQVVLLAGARQTGKTTLAREFLSPPSTNYFDLEDPISLARLEEPMTSLSNLQGLVVIDEIQRAPELFPILRVLCDREDNKANFLILGSATGDLMRQTSESLAGRIERIEISGFTLSETKSNEFEQLWLRGGFPLSFLAKSDEDSLEWRNQFASNLIERDFPQWGTNIPSTTLNRFWKMLAHNHGQVINLAEIARSMEKSQPTIGDYIDLFTDAFMIRQLQPFHKNIKKRQVKRPKVYFRDSGLLHAFLGINSLEQLYFHPAIGASWEGFALEQVIRSEKIREPMFWATHQGAEIDLVFEKEDGLYGVEFKRKDAPRMTKSMHIALNDLNLKSIAVVYPGEVRYQIDERVEAVPISSTENFGELFDD